MSEPTNPAEHRPFFNRSYLKYLGFIVAIAIVFLSEKPPEKLDQIIKLENSAIELGVLQVDSVSQFRLLLSFNSTPAFSAKQKIARELTYQSLLKSAALIEQVHSVLWTKDRLEIELRQSHQHNFDIARTLALLVQNSRQFRSEQAEKLLTAEQYLHNKAADNTALQTLFTRLARDYSASLSLNSMLKASPKALLITALELSAPEVKAIDRQLGDLFTRPAANLTHNIQWQTFTSLSTHRQPRHQLLIANQLAKTSNQNNALELVSTFVLGELLQAIAPVMDLKYRLVRQPIFERGYQALLLNTPTKLTARKLSSLRQALSQQPVENALISVKERLNNSYKALAEDPERLLKLYNKKYFYGLTTQSISEYEALLDTITIEQVRSQIDHLLGNNPIIIRLQPS